MEERRERGEGPGDPRDVDDVVPEFAGLEVVVKEKLVGESAGVMGGDGGGEE